MTDFQILGPFAVVDRGASIDLPGGRGRSLLALLTINAGQVLSADRIIDELWGESPPPTARTKLHGLISALRKSLGESGKGSGSRIIETHAPGYVLGIDRKQVDANRFRWLVEQSTTEDVSVRTKVLTEALALWRGPALGDFIYEPFAQADIRILEELRSKAREDLGDARLALGQPGEAIPDLEKLFETNPTRETVAGVLMKALYQEGRQSEALDVYRRLRQSLVESLGIEPGPRIRDLETAILRQDPTLDEPTGQTVEEGEQDASGLSWLPPGRRMVTVVFAGIVPGGDIADPERRQQVLRPVRDQAQEIFERHGGTVESLIGDVMVVVFGLPVGHEDDALRGVRSALELRAALSEHPNGGHPSGLAKVRIGIETGEVLAGRPDGGHPLASGSVVETANSLHGQARPGDVLIGDRTQSIAISAVKAERVAEPTGVSAWLVDGLATDAPLDGPAPSRFIGRKAELELLDRSLFDVRENETVRVVNVVGEAGIGKSSLAARFGAGLQTGVTVMIGRCPPYGDTTGTTMQELIMGAVGQDGLDGLTRLLGDGKDAKSAVDQLAAWAGLNPDEPRVTSLLPAFTSLVDSFTSGGPVVMVLDDLHWAEPVLLDLIEYLEANARGPLLILGLARPQFFDRDELRERLMSSRSIELAPLDNDSRRELIRTRGAYTLPDGVAGEIAVMAGGNPLFIEQLVASYEDQGRLDTAPSIEVLIRARLDRLGPGALDLARCAAVVGVEFSAQDLMAIAPQNARPFIERHLETLIDKQLIDRTARPPHGRPGYRFRHALIQRAAYRSVPAQTRSELHERIGSRLSDTSESDRIVGHHLERAFLDRERIGLVDEHTLDLARSAGGMLAAAGIRAFSSMDGAAAEDLLLRARDLLPPDDERIDEVEYRLVEAHTVMGRHDKSEELISSLLDRIAGTSDLRRKHLLTLERTRVRLALGPDPVTLDAITKIGRSTFDFFEQAGDESGMTQALYLMTVSELRKGRPAHMLTYARRQLEHADRGDSAREQLGARWMVAMALEDGPIHVDDCLAECEELVTWRDSECFGVLEVMAHLHAMAGGFERANELTARARRILAEQTRARRPLGLALRREAEIASMSGDLRKGEESLRQALEINLSMEERDQIAQSAALLSRLLSRRGDPEAAELAALATEQAPSESRAAGALARMAQARARLPVGEPREATLLAEEAVDMVPLDMLNLSADLRVDHVEILIASQQPDAVASVAEEAVELYRQKGNLVGARLAAASPT